MARQKMWDRKNQDSVLNKVQNPWGNHVFEVTEGYWVGGPMTFDQWWLKQRRRWDLLGDLAYNPEGLDETPMHHLVLGVTR